MKEKLVTLRQFRISKKDFIQDDGDRELFLKVIKSYFIGCILNNKDDFQIVFKGKYLNTFPERIYDWVVYIINSLYRLYLIRFTPNDDKTLKKYELIHYGVHKPVHVKISNTPNERLLEIYLKENGFKIVDEHLDSIDAIYDIAKI